jgi:hypothetical protein
LVWDIARTGLSTFGQVPGSDFAVGTRLTEMTFKSGPATARQDCRSHGHFSLELVDRIRLQP